MPHGYLHNSVPRDVLKSWTEDQHELLDAIADIEQATDDEVVHQELAQALMWDATHDHLPGVSERAAALIKRLEGPEEETVAALAHPWSQIDHEEKQARDTRVAARLVDESADGHALATALDRRLADIAERGGRPEVGAVLFEVCCLSPAHADGVWRWALANPAAMLSQAADVALDRLRREGVNVAELFALGWASPEPMGRRLAAAYPSVRARQAVVANGGPGA